MEQDKAKAVECYRKAAEQDYAPAQCNLGVLTLHGVGTEADPAAAAEWFRRAAEQSFARAQDHTH